jgi:diketogulonate reductase-like aldo/keto reductase
VATSPAIKLNDGRSIPQLGFGVYQTSPGEQAQNAVREALKVGYRHIDTAQFYRNEKDVGEAVRSSGLKRDEVFVTTKIANPNQGLEKTKFSLDKSLQQAGFDFFDLVLVHFPVTGKRLDTWRALIEMKKEGKAESIGVSNFTVRHLEELLAASDVVPAVNQVEFNPFCHQRELLVFCEKHGIKIQAYAPLTQGQRLAHPAITAVATKLKRTPGQVMLRWAVQHGLVVLPKSVTPSRIAENAAIFDFEIPASDMQALDALDENLRTCWDPSDVP